MAQASTDVLLRQEVMLHQFVNVTGCAPEQGRYLLEQCSWDYQIALSMFFQECCPVAGQQRCRSATSDSCYAPSNTPATPPNFPDAVFLFDALTVGGNANAGVSNAPQAANVANGSAQFKTPNRPNVTTAGSPQDLPPQADYRTTPS